MTTRLRTALFMLLALYTSLWPAAARAESADAGGQSVFAYGAGARALGMAGAATAAAPGAETIFWNPGALGWLERSSLQLGHASLYGLAMQEQYAALAWPSWRWGVLALGVQSYGVSEIQGRDESNLITAEDLENLEQQLSLAYARPFGAAWSLGASIKLRRQELAGYGGGAIGLDLGLVLKPALALGWESPGLAPLRAGLRLGNAVEPRLRLDSDAVGDPRSLRLGLGYARAIGALDWEAALDVEQVEERSLALHAGLELAYSLLALRAGWGYERLQAGAEIRWRDWGLDYVFEDNALETVHRFGLSLRFGADLPSQRLAAARAQDEALQARLDEAFAARQRARIDELMATATAEREAARQEEALALLATVLALEPEHARALALAARCHADFAEGLEREGDFGAAALSYHRALTFLPEQPQLVASLARCQTESDRRAQRGAALRERYAAGLDAFGAGRLTEARSTFAELLAQQPEDADAAAMLQRSEEAIAARVAGSLGRARDSLERGLVDDAAQRLAEAAALAPTDASVVGFRRRLDEARRAESARREAGGRVVSAPAAAAPATVALTARERTELAELYRRGVAAAEAGRGEEALRYWELVWTKDPKHQQVAEHLKREYLVRGMETFAAGRLEAAAALWEKALAIDPTDERAQGYLARARAQLARSEEIFKR